MLSELVIYTFDVKLLFNNGKEEYVPFRIIGRRGKRAAAEAELKKWLETDGHKHSGYKYIEWVGIRDKSCDFVLINPDQENIEELINESKEYIKEND